METIAVLAGKNIHFARHVETTKNLHDIHGESDECKPTPWTKHQISALIRYIKINGVTKILSGSTTQCAYTSSALKLMLNIDAIGLDLLPINLGKYAGLSHSEFRRFNRRLANAMELFRYRVLPYNKTILKELADPDIMANEIGRWWNTQGQHIGNDAIFILSNSLLVKLTNFSQGILPTSDRYLNVGFANGAAVPVDEWDIEMDQWPAIKHKTLTTACGDVILTEYIPKLSILNKVTALIYPGIFGSSRFGPYNLYNRMARELAEYGVRSAVFDPVGSGESPPIYRCLETELASLDAVTNYYVKCGPVALCAHSLSANLLYKHISSARIHKYLMAPVIDIGARKAAWGIDGENMSRHGLDFSSDLWDDNGLISFGSDSDVDYYFGTCDRYVDHKQVESLIHKGRIHFIEGAGHNFSEGNTSNALIQQIVEDIIGYAWQNNGHAADGKIQCVTKS
ncbi:MAG: hypothetical protein GY839_19530 [candidate division Zixibacteria bacterium]|nr:hypothetical protein [candidate division Zixibacteria bacterium]